MVYGSSCAGSDRGHYNSDSDNSGDNHFYQEDMKKKTDWYIEDCEDCKHLEHTPIRDALCQKTGKYLWTNDWKLTNVPGREISKPYKYIPSWCPLENYKDRPMGR